MKVLSLGTDEHLFEKESAVRQRQLVYARALGELDLIVLSRRPHAPQREGALSMQAIVGDSLGRLFRAYRLMKRSERPDVVTVQDPFELGLVGYFVARHFNVPLHVQVHTDFLVQEYARHSFTNRVRRVLASFVLHRASRIRVVSKVIKEKIEVRYGPHAPVTVLPIFVDVGKFRNAKASAEVAARFAAFRTKVLVVARLEPEKNVVLAVRSFAQAAPNNACLIVVGEGSEREHLEEITRALASADRVFFEGEHPAVEYYPLADLVLVPSAYEGYGLVIVEALASGKPVLSTDVGIAREAGAMVSSEADLTTDLTHWFESGPRQGELRNYPYMDLDQYCKDYCNDIAACTKAE